jgi:hypothetical protein
VSRSIGPSLPDPVRALLTGDQLEARIGLTLQLLTTDESGWPAMALLSAGEVLATGPSEVRLALWPASGATRNLGRDGRATLALAHGGDAYYVRLRAGPSMPLELEGTRLARFDAAVEDVLWDHVGYARISSGVTFELPDPAATLPRWQAVITALRGPAKA